MISGSPTPEGRTNPSAVRFTSVHLLIALAILLFASPFIQELPAAKVIQRFLIAVVFLSALFAVAGRGSLLVGSLLAAAAWIDIRHRVIPDCCPVFPASGHRVPDLCDRPGARLYPFGDRS